MVGIHSVIFQIGRIFNFATLRRGTVHKKSGVNFRLVFGLENFAFLHLKISFIDHTFGTYFYNTLFLYRVSFFSAAHWFDLKLISDIVHFCLLYSVFLFIFFHICFVR